MTIGDAGLVLALHDLVRSDPFCAVQFGTSYLNLRHPHIFWCQISGKKLVLHLSKYGTYQFPQRMILVSSISL
jgi:hypothetical protein